MITFIKSHISNPFKERLEEYENEINQTLKLSGFFNVFTILESDPFFQGAG
jgi:hypothetical protein